MKIIIEPHTLERAKERGASKDEIYEVILDGIVIPAKNNRFENIKHLFLSRKETAFYTNRNGLRFIILSKTK